MTPRLADLTDRLTRAQRVYRAACDGAMLMFPTQPRLPPIGRVVYPLPESSTRREALRQRVRALEQQVAAETGRSAIRYVNGTGRWAR